MTLPQMLWVLVSPSPEIPIFLFCQLTRRSRREEPRLLSNDPGRGLPWESNGTSRSQPNFNLGAHIAVRVGSEEYRSRRHTLTEFHLLQLHLYRGGLLGIA